MKKAISLVLTLVLLLAVFVGCNKTPDNPDNPNKPQINKTDIKIVDNGATDYKIVVPSGASNFVNTAASELVNFVKEATGATLPVTTDGEEFSTLEKVISLGKTTVFDGSGVKLTEKLRETGYVMKRKGNTLIINAKDDNGIVSAVYVGNDDLSERLVNLFAPDFVFCHTDITNVAEENNHVISAYIARLNATLKAFERYKAAHIDDVNDVFDDLHANLALQYAQLSLSALGNKVFDEYEYGGVATVQPYLATIERAETLFDTAQNIGGKLWAKYRGGITSYGNAWQSLCKGNKQLVADLRKDLDSVVGQKRGVLRLRFMLPDTYASIRTEVFVRYVGQSEDTLLYRGSTKTMLTMLDVSGEYVLRFATEPQPIEYVLFAAYGEGAQYPVYAEHFDGNFWHAPVAAKIACGIVKNEQNILHNNASFVVLGIDDGRAHLDDMSLCKQRNAIEIVF